SYSTPPAVLCSLSLHDALPIWVMPDDGRMVLQTIMGHPMKRWPEMGIPITISDLKFMRFILKEIFPGGAVPCDDDVVEFAGNAGDRKSTRLNSSHVKISYAVFC